MTRDRAVVCDYYGRRLVDRLPPGCPFLAASASRVIDTMTAEAWKIIGDDSAEDRSEGFVLLSRAEACRRCRDENLTTAVVRRMRGVA